MFSLVNQLFNLSAYLQSFFFLSDFLCHCRSHKPCAWAYMHIHRQIQLPTFACFICGDIHLPFLFICIDLSSTRFVNTHHEREPFFYSLMQNGKIISHGVDAPHYHRQTYTATYWIVKLTCIQWFSVSIAYISKNPWLYHDISIAHVHMSRLESMSWHLCEDAPQFTRRKHGKNTLNSTACKIYIAIHIDHKIRRSRFFHTLTKFRE